MFVGGGDGAVDMQILDGGASDKAERGGGYVLGGRVVEGQRVTVAVEGAFERLGVKAIGTCSQHRGDADVVVKLEILAAVVRAGCHVGGQLVPVGGRSDEVWVLGRTVAATKGGCCPRRGDAEQLCKQQQCCATKISVHYYFTCFVNIVIYGCKGTKDF